jgi:hypothetical protein
LIDDAFLQALAVSGLDAALHEIDRRLKALVHMGLGRAARRNDDLQQGEALCAGVLARDPEEVRKRLLRCRGFGHAHRDEIFAVAFADDGRLARHGMREQERERGKTIEEGDRQGACAARRTAA